MKSKKSTKNRVAIGMDVGGTDIKSALVTSLGKVIHLKCIPTQSHASPEIILNNILKSVQTQLKKAHTLKCEVLGFGFGIPGIVSTKGVVHHSPHFPNWNDYPIQDELKKNLDLPFVVDNDANFAALGEGWIGAAQKFNNYILLTLGTGIGGGIVLNRQVFRGDSGFAGEIGHMILEKNGLLCNCGGRGCLELYASASGIARVSPFEADKLFDMAKRGNKKARAIFEEFGESLGAGIASLVNVLDVEHILLGGGLCGAWDLFIQSLRQGIKDHIYPTTAHKIRLLKAKLGNQAGVVGAAKGVLNFIDS